MDHSADLQAMRRVHRRRSQRIVFRSLDSGAAARNQHMEPSIPAVGLL